MLSLFEAARDVMAFLHAKIHELPLGFEEKDQKDVEDLLAPDLRILAKQRWAQCEKKEDSEEDSEEDS